MLCTARSRRCARESKLTTHHICMVDIPDIIAHRPPDPIQTNLYTTIVSSTINQTNRRALYTSITAVGTVMFSPATVTAVIDIWLASRACHIIHPYWTGSLTISSPSDSSRGLLISKLFAHHVGVVYVPSIVANRTPLAVIEDFNSSSWWRISIKTDTSCWDG